MHLLMLFRDAYRTRDFSITIVVLPLALVFIWLNLLPLHREVRHVALERFHLLTPSFGGWAIQQPIPAMYNFQNTCKVYRLTNAAESNDSLLHQETLNHFPTRFLTCADQRGVSKEPRLIRLSSRYQDSSISTLWTTVPQLDGGVVLTRQPGR